MNDTSHPRNERVKPTIRGLLSLAWPIVVSRSSQSVVGLADALMVAHLGESALAATTTGALNSFALFILPMGTVFIVSSFASQYFGKGDLAGARRYALYGLIIAAATQALVFLAYAWVPDAIAAFSFEPEMAALLRQYLMIRLGSSALVVGVEALANYYGGLGNTRLPMLASLVAMVLNVVGNWLLIDGRFGLPALGVAGAAWASVASTGVAFLILFGVFVADGRRAGRVFPRLHLRELGRTLRYGVPSGFNWFFEFAAFLFFVNVVVAQLGTTVLAAMMAVMQLNSVAFMPAFALASAGAIVVGQAIGANARDEVPTTVKRTFLVAASWQGLMGLLYLAVPQVLFRPFVHGDPNGALMAAGQRMLMLSAAWQLFDAAASTLAESLRGAGDTAFTLWARLILAWVLFVPGSWLSVHHYGGGDVAAMLWLVAYLAALALVLLLRFRTGAWRRFDLAHGEGVPAV